MRITASAFDWLMTNFVTELYIIRAPTDNARSCTTRTQHDGNAYMYLLRRTHTFQRRFLQKPGCFLAALSGSTIGLYSRRTAEHEPVSHCLVRFLREFGGTVTRLPGMPRVPCRYNTVELLQYGTE